MLQELRSGIQILQSQDNQRVMEASDLLKGIRQDMEAISKRISDNALQILAVKDSTRNVQ